MCCKMLSRKYSLRICVFPARPLGCCRVWVRLGSRWAPSRLGGCLRESQELSPRRWQELSMAHCLEGAQLRQPNLFAIAAPNNIVSPVAFPLSLFCEARRGAEISRGFRFELVQVSLQDVRIVRRMRRVRSVRRERFLWYLLIG